jgi:hypothetical protein
LILVLGVTESKVAAPKTWVVVTAIVVLSPVAFLLAWSAMIRFDAYRVERICSDVRLGASLDDVRGQLEKWSLEHAANPPLGSKGEHRHIPSNGDEGVLINALWTWGDYGCAINMINGRVTATTFLQP